MKIRITKLFSLAAAFGLAAAASAADQPASGSPSSGSPKEQVPPPAAQSCQQPSIFYDGPAVIDNDNGNDHRYGIQAGSELHFLRPVINNNFAFATIITPAGGGFSNTNQNFRYNYSTDVSFWLGYTLDSGLGFRTTWFHESAPAQPITVTNSFVGPGGLTPFFFAATFVPTTGVALAAVQVDVVNL